MSNSKNSGQETLRCSFCGRSELEVNNLIVQDNACICDNCVRACGDIIARDKVQQQVEEADERLQALKRQEGLVKIEERRTLLNQRLSELGTALNERKTERLQKEALWRQMASAASVRLMAPPSGLAGSGRSGLRAMGIGRRSSASQTPRAQSAAITSR